MLILFYNVIREIPEMGNDERLFVSIRYSFRCIHFHCHFQVFLCDSLWAQQIYHHTHEVYTIIVNISFTSPNTNTSFTNNLQHIIWGLWLKTYTQNMNKYTHTHQMHGHFVWHWLDRHIDTWDRQWTREIETENERVHESIFWVAVSSGMIKYEVWIRHVNYTLYIF